MRVVWKDSNARLRTPLKYRGHILEGYKDGWVIDIPGDDNIYNSHYDAQNAIDAAYGDSGRGSEKRRSYGIKIIGKKGDESA